jgi:predicted nucleic acid-binding protein
VTTYLLDTNIILRFSNPSDGQHELVTNAVAAILRQGDECYLAPQVLIEMWVVATRPTDVNGLGWSTTYTRNIIDQLMQRFPMVEEVPQLFLTWLDIVSTYKILGKRTHDARIGRWWLADESRRTNFTYGPQGTKVPELVIDTIGEGSGSLYTCHEAKWYTISLD